MFTRASRQELELQLQQLNEQITNHPFASNEIQRAQQIIERHDKSETEQIARELAAAGLPSLEQLGMLQVKHIGSWWRLHRDRNRVAKKLAKRSS